MMISQDGMLPTEGMRTEQKRREYWVIAAIVIANITALAWSFWPVQKDEYAACLERAADKARGNATIFNQLTYANCYKLSPAYLEQKTKELDAEIFLGK